MGNYLLNKAIGAIFKTFYKYTKLMGDLRYF